MTDLNGDLGALAEAFLLAEADDPHALAGLHLVFGNLGKEWTGPYPEHAASACSAAQARLERIILGECADAAAELTLVSQGISYLQGLADGRAPAEAPGPAAGGAGEATTGAASAPHESDAELDPSLLADFVRESQEHLETAESRLLSQPPGPADADTINAVFRAFHTIKGTAGFLGLASIQRFAHETENLFDKVRTGKLNLEGGLLDVTFEAVDAVKKRIRWLAESGSPYPEAEARSMESVLSRVKASAEGGAPAANPAAVPLPPRSAEPESPKAEAHRPEGQPPGARREGAAVVKETVKVEAERLDRLLDAIGELVIAESMIFQSPELKERKSPALAQQMAQLDKITRELQQMGTSLRMVPMRPVFQKMARLVRDVSRKAGKDVEFVSSGEETELDKTVVDRIGDPLVHMVRNSVDHGIEPDAASRIEAGKPVQAKVCLRAFQKGGSVCIQVQDDGRGLNRDAILRKARDRGLLRDDGASLSDQEVWNFIFEAGFSTAAQVTEISGRGVGMDVVRRTIEDLRGRIDIESQAGQGTTFSIWLPLTLAIIDGMVVRHRGERYVFPTLSILRIVPFLPGEVHTVEDKGEMLLQQGELIPILRLDMLAPGGAAASSAETRRLVVIVETAGRKAGLPVDELLGQQQVVIKRLGESLNQVQGLSGGAILSDGAVGLILDVDGLMKTLRAEPVGA